MAKLTANDLLKEIEDLRDQLHAKVSKGEFEHQELMTTELLQISKKLDELILKYMFIVKNS